MRKHRYIRFMLGDFLSSHHFSQLMLLRCSSCSYVTFFGEEFCYEDSPYVVQTQSVFGLDVHLSLEKIFCRLANKWLTARGLSNSGRLFAAEYGSKNVPDTCFDGKSRGEISLEFISQIWDAYSAPKFGKVRIIILQITLNFSSFTIS